MIYTAPCFCNILVKDRNGSPTYESFSWIFVLAGFKIDIRLLDWTGITIIKNMRHIFFRFLLFHSKKKQVWLRALNTDSSIQIFINLELQYQLKYVVRT